MTFVTLTFPRFSLDAKRIFLQSQFKGTTLAQRLIKYLLTPLISADSSQSYYRLFPLSTAILAVAANLQPGNHHAEAALG
jgi:hypothetical protein